MDINKIIIETYFKPPFQTKIDTKKMFKEENEENIKKFITDTIKPDIEILMKDEKKKEYAKEIFKLLIKGDFVKEKKKTYKQIMEELISTKPKKTNKQYKSEYREKLKNKLFSQFPDKVEKI